MVNGWLVTLGMLSRLGGKLISVSGQHEHQLLLRPENHLQLLDEFGGLSEQRGELRERHSRYQLLRSEIRNLEIEMAAISEKQELTQFQIQEIERAEIQPGEDELLEEQKRRLQHAEELSAIVTGGYQALYEKDDSVIEAVSQCVKQLERAVGIDPDLKPTADDLRDIQLRLEDAAYALRDFQGQIDLDPRALESVLERVEVLHGLKRKYGPTLDDVIRFKEQLASTIFEGEERQNRMQRLKEEHDALVSDLLERAGALSQKRKAVARKLEKAVEQELHQLHMKKTRFEVRFSDRPGQGRIGDVGPDGLDELEFMISPNPGEELRALSKIASGGELSRIMLALKTILAGTASVETVIFDEVDSGIGGATAEVVGEKLLSLSRFHQILCITHLPQIATQGQTHFLVQKRIADRRTETVISELEPEERVMEIARLLAGREITPQALAHAREMLR
jgi:DNA repair protein RecN (Recombination protein N)